MTLRNFDIVDLPESHFINETPQLGCRLEILNRLGSLNDLLWKDFEQRVPRVYAA